VMICVVIIIFVGVSGGHVFIYFGKIRIACNFVFLGFGFL
jgi:hypothetical protein